MLAQQLAPPRTTIDVDGAVEGYASVFGVVDPARDMMLPGAFARTLRSARRIPMLFSRACRPAIPMADNGQAEVGPVCAARRKVQSRAITSFSLKGISAF